MRRSLLSKVQRETKPPGRSLAASTVCSVWDSYDHSVAQLVSLASVSVTQLVHNKKQPITVSCDIILQSCCLLLFALLLVVHHSFFDLLHHYYTISDYYT